MQWSAKRVANCNSTTYPHYIILGGAMSPRTLPLVAYILQPLVMDATSFTISDAELIQAAENAELYYEEQLTDADLIEAAQKAERYFEQQVTDTELIEAAESAERICQHHLTDTELIEAAEWAEHIYEEQQLEHQQKKEENAFIDAINVESWQPLSLNEEAELIEAVVNAEGC